MIVIEPRHYTLPPKARIYAYSDIHGCFDVFRKSEALINQDLKYNPPGSGRVIYKIRLGDLVDKGDGTKDVIDGVMKSDRRNINLIANHEKGLIDFINGPAHTDDPYWLAQSAGWFGYGSGFATLRSYGVRNLEEFGNDVRAQARMAITETCASRPQRYMEDLRKKLLRALIETGHIEYFNNLYATASWTHFGFCHAELKPHKPIREHSVEEVIEGRSIVKYKGAFQDGRVIIHGHSHGHNFKDGAKSERPIVRPYSIGIDPASIHTGEALVAVLGAGDEVRFLRSDGKYTAPVRKPRAPEEGWPDLKPRHVNGHSAIHVKHDKKRTPPSVADSAAETAGEPFRSRPTRSQKKLLRRQARTEAALEAARAGTYSRMINRYNSPEL